MFFLDFKLKSKTLKKRKNINIFACVCVCGYFDCQQYSVVIFEPVVLLCNMRLSHSMEGRGSACDQCSSFLHCVVTAEL